MTAGRPRNPHSINGARQRPGLKLLARLSATREGRKSRPAHAKLKHLARPEGFEPPTNGFGSHYSIRLSYGRELRIVPDRGVAREPTVACAVRASDSVAATTAARSHATTVPYGGSLAC
jgi:hypothetical protein